MSKVNHFLNERMKGKKTAQNKMALMAKQTVMGNRSSGANFFQKVELTHQEERSLSELLETYALSSSFIQEDLKELTMLTKEVKAIHHQAALLHGERIQSAHQILVKYRDGAFTAWLIAAYGNRQTPYNFFQYHRFHSSLPETLRPSMEKMPRQAIYSLASREGDEKIKHDFIKNYQGETKNELLDKIRVLFPLKETDKRRPSKTDKILQTLSHVASLVVSQKKHLSKKQKESIKALLDTISRELFLIID